MRTEEFIRTDHTDIDWDNFDYPELSHEEILNIEKMFEFTRHFIEIDQLYRVYKVNFNEILYHFRLNTNDIIEKMIKCNDEMEDFIIINALVINYISSPKTFIEMLEIFNINKLGEEINATFKDKCLSKIYDEIFSYRLLIRLRDFSQHGHLPVDESWDKKYCFDLERILNTPYFKHNSKLEKEMKEIKKIIDKKYKDYPRIAFTRTIAEFNICIIEIYKSFIELIMPEMKRQVEIFSDLISKRPEIIHNSEDKRLNGNIVYLGEDGYEHVFSCNYNPMKKLELIRTDLEKNYEKEKEIFQDCFKKSWREGK